MKYPFFVARFRRIILHASLALAPLFAGCSAMPAKHVYTEIDIGAPVERVWAILADNRSYPDWNPYHVRVEGRLEVGERLDVEIHKPNGETVKIEPHVLRVEPLRELTWGGGLPGVFVGEHVFLLESLNGDSTRLIQRETFRGIAVPFASLDAIDEGYRRMNAALKMRAELE